MSKIAHIVRNALKPGYAVEMARKVGYRLARRNRLANREEVIAWCRSEAVPIDGWARRLDPGLWDEATLFSRQQQEIAAERLEGLGIDLGGGGAYDLLYFLTRLLKPRVVVETGVAAGFSSRAFLTALRANGGGELHSSDFPYFRLANPESLIGYLVEPELRASWDLHTKGDRKNLRAIAGSIGRLDLLHYDSDKSYEGREFVLRALGRYVTPDTLILYDDIQDNSHFHDLVRAQGRPYRIFEFEGKWVGMTGGPGHFYA